MRIRFSFTVCALFFALIRLASADDLAYRKPAKEIVDAINTPPPPTISVSPTRDYGVLMETLAHPSISDLAEPMHRLAGLRIHGPTNGPHLPPANIRSITIKL